MELSHQSGEPPKRSADHECTIVHLDMDAFYASVETLDAPHLDGQPVVVAGLGPRGVVSSCSYSARLRGVRSAMPTAKARRICPEGVFLPGRFARYREVSARLHAILLRYTPLVEPIALDEAFLDVSGSRRLFGSPPEIARLLREDVHQELRLACGIGVARTKQLAKLASKSAKPTTNGGLLRPGSGLVVILPDEEQAFLGPLPVRALWGVGPVLGDKLAALGVVRVAQLAALPKDRLCKLVGRAAGDRLAALACGQDISPVSPNQEAKSVGHEETFDHDLVDPEQIDRELIGLVERLSDRVRGISDAVTPEGVPRPAGELGESTGEGSWGRRVTVKVRLADFALVTRSATLSHRITGPRELRHVARRLLDKIDSSSGMRLLGVTMSEFTDHQVGSQLSLFGEDPDPNSEPISDFGSRRDTPQCSELQTAVAAIKSRYGGQAVLPATLTVRR